MEDDHAEPQADMDFDGFGGIPGRLRWRVARCNPGARGIAASNSFHTAFAIHVDYARSPNQRPTPNFHGGLHSEGDVYNHASITHTPLYHGNARGWGDVCAGGVQDRDAAS